MRSNELAYVHSVLGRSVEIQQYQQIISTGLKIDSETKEVKTCIKIFSLSLLMLIFLQVAKNLMIVVS